jgi:hypothetical protein
MADESMQMPGDDQDEDILQPDTQIPVPLDSLEADGQRPRVGDLVTVKVDGRVESIVDDYAYITAENINDTDINRILADTQDQDEDSAMARMARDADTAGTPMGGGDSYMQG